MKKVRGILRVIMIVLLSLILAVNLWLITARVLLHQEQPKIFGYSQAVVLSGSMEPTFSAGDMLIFRQQDFYGTGDIIIFQQENALVTHRIVGQTKDGFITKGDANNTEDQAILSPSLIEGKMIAVIPRMGDAFAFFRSPLGLLILILIGLMMVEWQNITASFKKRKREEKR